jgi:hypothetical protein
VKNTRAMKLVASIKLTPTFEEAQPRKFGKHAAHP